MGARISGVPVAFVYAADRDRALRFYRDTLGLPLRSADDFGDFLEIDGGLLRLTVIPDYAPHPHPVVGWNVADIDAAVTTLGEQGVAFIHYDGMGQDERGVWTSPDGLRRIAFFADPDGNILMLSQV